MCVCSSLSPISSGVGVHVLQDPRERRHPLGTARLLRLGLDAIHVHVLAPRGPSAPVAFPEGAALLYPGPGARDLATLPAAARPSHLVVIDGTWSQAHRIFRDNPWVRGLPRVCVVPPEPSRYRIRAEPRSECLSTVEAVVLALRCLRPDLQGVDTLISAFDSMIDAQIAASAQASSEPRRKRPRRARTLPIPPSLLDPSASIVLAYAEPEPFPAGGREDRSAIRLSALSLAGARVFDQVVQTPFPPDAYLAAEMGLPADALGAARPRHEVLTSFRAFCHASEGAPVAVSWNAWTQSWLQARNPEVPALFLKGVWANLQGGRVPALDALVDGLGLHRSEARVTGRAGRRLAGLQAMARHILSEAARAR